jgi:hypothetical protein
MPAGSRGRYGPVVLEGDVFVRRLAEVVRRIRVEIFAGLFRGGFVDALPGGLEVRQESPQVVRQVTAARCSVRLSTFLTCHELARFTNQRHLRASTRQGLD